MSVHIRIHVCKFNLYTYSYVSFLSGLLGQSQLKRSTVTTDLGLKRLRTGFTYTNLHPPNLRTRELSFRSRVCKFSLCTCTVHIHIYVCKYGVLQCVVVPCRALHVLQCVAYENMGIWKCVYIGATAVQPRLSHL